MERVVQNQCRGWSGFLSAVFLGGLAVLGWNVPAIAQAICPSELAARIQAIESRPPLERTRWGILVRTLETGETLYAQDAQDYFIPASNAKLLTTAAALTSLGSSYQIRTSVYQVNADTAGVTLRVVGRGDPTLTQASLQSLTQQIRDRGITHITQLIADDSYFQGDPLNPNWEWEDIQAGYGAPINSLILNRNAIALTLVPQALGQPLRVVWDNPAEVRGWEIDNRSRTVAGTEPEFTQVGRAADAPVLRVAGQLRVGAEPEPEAISVPNPTRYFLQALQRTLVASGIEVDRVAIASTPATNANAEVEIATVTSPPLSTLLGEANRESENLFAESMLRILGVMRSPDPSLSSLEAGLAAVEATLAPLGVDPETYALVDGSGLSRKNLATPEALVQTLRAIAQTPNAEIYRNSLAIAGTSGTLSNRFRDTPVEGRLWGKTGAISGIAALSGYLDPPNYPPLAFSILVNHFDQPVRTLRPNIDEIVLLLAQLQPCQSGN